MAFAMSPSPRALLRLIQLGQMEDALSSNAPWLCATCYGCSVSCPSGIDLTALMYSLRQLAMDSDVPNESVGFYREFVANLLKRGTVYEPELLLAYALRAGLKTLLPHVGMGLRMVSQGKLTYRPRSIPEAARLAEAVASLK